MKQAQELLNWQLQAGVDIAMNDQPVDRFAESAQIKENHGGRQKPAASGKKTTQGSPLAQRIAASTPKPPLSQKPGMTGAVAPDEGLIKTAREIAQAATTIEELKEALAGFEGCNLRLTAKNLVFADGNPNSEVMFVGEAAGRDEDLQGLPFVGRSGQLLDKMLSAINLARENVYISNVIPWRPPGNRPPTPAETELCFPFIERHIELAAPRVLVMLGGSSAKTLLRTTEGILRLRGKWQEISFGSHKLDAIPTLHPAYLLRQPVQKKLAWQDFLKVKMKLNG